jgi:hypothetical protein
MFFRITAIRVLTLEDPEEGLKSHEMRRYNKEGSDLNWRYRIPSTSFLLPVTAISNHT